MTNDHLRPRGDWKAARPRTNGIAALEIWFEHQYSRGHKRLHRWVDSEPGEPNVPDEIVRSESFIGSSTGRPDGASAWGVESAEPGRSKPPYGRSTYLDVVNRDEYERFRDRSAQRTEVLKIMVPAMDRLGVINTSSMLTLEMRSSGWSWQAIAHWFDTSRPQIQMWWECGLTWIGGCLVVKPDFTAGFEALPRHTLRADLYPSRKVKEYRCECGAYVWPSDTPPKKQLPCPLCLPGELYQRRHSSIR